MIATLTVDEGVGTMRTPAESIGEVISRMRRNEREREHCLKMLYLWGEVEAQGIDIGQVASFGFADRALTDREKRDLRFHPDKYIETLASGKTRARLHNYVRIRDGTVKRLCPMLKAVYEDKA